MTTRQQNELLEIMIDCSDIFYDNDIVTSIMFCRYRKNYFKFLRQIIAIFNGINPCTNDLLKAIIENGGLDINGIFVSITKPEDKHYDEFKKLIEERNEHYEELKALIKEKRHNDR